MPLEEREQQQGKEGEQPPQKVLTTLRDMKITPTLTKYNSKETKVFKKRCQNRHPNGFSPLIPLANLNIKKKNQTKNLPNSAHER